MLHDYSPTRIIVGSAALTTALVAVQMFLIRVPLQPRHTVATLAAGVILGFLGYVVSIWLELMRDRAAGEEYEATQIVRAAAFFADSDAILGPNHSEHAARIRDTVSDFTDRHGVDSAWILPHPDSEGLSADTLFLVCHQLPGQISDELHLCGAGPITRLTRSQMSRLFPTRVSSDRAYVIVWD